MKKRTCEELGVCGNQKINAQNARGAQCARNVRVQNNRWGERASERRVGTNQQQRNANQNVNVTSNGNALNVNVQRN